MNRNSTLLACVWFAWVAFGGCWSPTIVFTLLKIEVGFGWNNKKSDFCTFQNPFLLKIKSVQWFLQIRFFYFKKGQIKLTAMLNKAPIGFPSSYRANFERTNSRTPINLSWKIEDISNNCILSDTWMQVSMSLSIVSNVSSSFDWYLYWKNKIVIFRRRRMIRKDWKIIFSLR